METILYRNTGIQYKVHVVQVLMWDLQGWTKPKGNSSPGKKKKTKKHKTKQKTNRQKKNMPL